MGHAADLWMVSDWQNCGWSRHQIEDRLAWGTNGKNFGVITSVSVAASSSVVAWRACMRPLARCGCAIHVHWLSNYAQTLEIAGFAALLDCPLWHAVICVSTILDIADRNKSHLHTVKSLPSFSYHADAGWNTRLCPRHSKESVLQYFTALPHLSRAASQLATDHCCTCPRGQQAGVIDWHSVWQRGAQHCPRGSKLDSRRMSSL